MNQTQPGIVAGRTTRSVRPLALVATLALVVAACASPASPSPAASGPPGSASGSPALSSNSPGPASSATAGGSTAPSGSAAPSPPASAAPAPGGVDAAAAACSGSASTKDFFVAIAQAVQWPVYCAVLPAGWSIVSGSYRLANGGQMNVEYRNLAGATFQLKEGHWCTDGVSACSPHDVFVGPAAFGDQQGELGSLGSGFVLYVAAGTAPSWTASGSGIDEATFGAFCAALATVAA